MRVICSPTLLAHALVAMSHQIKQERNNGILLSAANSESGMVTLGAMGAGGMMGILHSIPATIEEEGDATVPIEPFAEYIGLLRSPSVTLSQERQQTTPVHGSWIHNGVPLPPLVVESTSTSLAGTTATDRARFKPWIAEDSPFPPLAHWQREGRLLTTIPASVLQQALSTCMPFVPQMEGMLIEVEADHINFIAMTETAMIHYHFPLEHPSTSPCSLRLPGHVLRYLKRMLPKDGMITLSLTQDEDSPILIFAMSGLIAFCRGRKPLLLQWKQLLHAAEEGAVTLSRQDLSRALAPFASRSIDDAQVMRFSIEDATTSMSLVTNGDIVLRRSVEIQHVGPPTHLSVLVHPMQLKRIVHALPAATTTTSTLTLDIGHTERWKKYVRERVGFLRVRSAHVTAIMGLSKRVRSSALEMSSMSTQEGPKQISKHLPTSAVIDEKEVHEKERV